jgi:hypothetical protein
MSGYLNGNSQPEPADGPKPDRRWTAAMAVLVALFVAMASFDLISGGVASADRPSASRTAAASGTASARSATPVPSRDASSTPGPAPRPVAVRLLTIASAAAYGPDGTSDGDHPDLAPGVINGGDGQPWHSSWYASPEFGNLQSGTGLLLDMGETVKLSRVQLVLGSPVGTDVRVQVGDASLAEELPVAASAFDAGGTVQLRLAEAASGRYVLIWFTRLPPDSPGKYQVSVYGVTVYGTKRTLSSGSAEVIEQT